MEANRLQDSNPDARTTADTTTFPAVRSAIAGVLMGLANLVPGISGGTMIVVMGLYDEFITSVADVTRLRLTKRNVIFLGIIGCMAAAAIGALAGTLSRAVILHRSAMFSLFIGLTLGGAPLLVKMITRFRVASVMGCVIGLAAMVAIAVTNDEPPDRDAIKQAVAEGKFVVEDDYLRDVMAGALGMSAMVLPGISGAYMLLILGRYETILAAVSMTKDYALSLGEKGEAGAFLAVIVPTGIGALIALIGLSNFLKWMLHAHRDLTIGLLLGILLGSVVGIWPFDHTSLPRDYLLGGVLALAGFIATTALSRIKA
jgi:putative membrane protein